MTLAPPVHDRPAVRPVRPASAWAAMRSPRYLLSRWAWGAVAHVVTSAVLVLLLALPLAVASAPLTTLVGSGGRASPLGVLLALAASLALATAVFVLAATPVARLDLARARLVDARALPAPVEPRARAERWRRRLTERAGWLRVLHVAVTCTVGAACLLVVLGVFLLAGTMLLAPALVSAEGPIHFGPWQVQTVPEGWLAAAVGLVPLLATPYLCGLLASGQVALGRLLLVDPTARLQAQLVDLTRSRARLVHGFDAERRRIERDLHDGAQQRVVALTMHLGLARMELEEQLGADHPATRQVAVAHEQARDLIGQLRAFIRGIHPQVLSDVGLGAALDQLASTLPLPVAVHDALGERPEPHVESTVYFSVSEALTNVVRHSGATRADVALRREDGAVVADVLDDGRGGADPHGGTGLSGMADRAAVVGGTVSVSSPPGGPTRVRVRVPVLAGDAR